MSMEHWERRKWCEHISEINRNLNGEPEQVNVFDVFDKG